MSKSKEPTREEMLECINQINQPQSFVLSGIRRLIEQGKPIEIIENLIKAFASLMDEFSQTKTIDWGIVNDALLAGEKYLRINKINKAGIEVSEEKEQK